MNLFIILLSITIVQSTPINNKLKTNKINLLNNGIHGNNQIKENIILQSNNYLEEMYFYQIWKKLQN